jgi:hypothetical protein
LQEDFAIRAVAEGVTVNGQTFPPLGLQTALTSYAAGSERFQQLLESLRSECAGKFEEDEIDQIATALEGDALLKEVSVRLPKSFCTIIF